MPVLQIIWVRFMVNTLLIVVMLGPRQVRRALPSNKLMNQLLRSVFLIGATAFNFLALQHLQLDQTATIFFLSPFIVAASQGRRSGEWIGWHRILAICVGFTGVLFVTRPGFGNIHWAVSFSLLATLSYALYILWTRYLARFDSARTTLVYTPLAGAVFVAPLAFASWQMPVGIWVWSVLLSLGLLGGFGHRLLILAHERAPAPILAPFGYISIVFMIALGFTVFGDVPSLVDLDRRGDHNPFRGLLTFPGALWVWLGRFLRDRGRRIGFADAGGEGFEIAFANDWRMAAISSW